MRLNKINGGWTTILQLTNNINVDSGSGGRNLWIGLYQYNYIYFNFADRNSV